MTAEQEAELCKMFDELEDIFAKEFMDTMMPQPLASGSSPVISFEAYSFDKKPIAFSDSSAVCVKRI